MDNLTNVVDIADSKKVRLVYGCGQCQDQGHRLLEEGIIICGQLTCNAVSAFMWFVPLTPRVGDEKRKPRLKASINDGKNNLVCAKCSHNRFHLHPSGTLTCFRCKFTAAWKWWNPDGEEGSQS